MNCTLLTKQMIADQSRNGIIRKINCLEAELVEIVPDFIERSFTNISVKKRSGDPFTDAKLIIEGTGRDATIAFRSDIFNCDIGTIGYIATHVLQIMMTDTDCTCSEAIYKAVDKDVITKVLNSLGG